MRVNVNNLEKPVCEARCVAVNRAPYDGESINKGKVEILKSLWLECELICEARLSTSRGRTRLEERIKEKSGCSI